METQTFNISGSSGSLIENLFNSSVEVSGSSLEFPKDTKELLYFYIDLGWIITPNYGIYKNSCNCVLREKCKNPGKHPRSSNGKVLETKDKNQIDIWLSDKKIKYSNWAVKCGKESGIIAFDIDPRHGGKRDAFDFPPTLDYKTGGGGWRLIYQYPDFDIESNNKFGEGIELIANGFVVVPPSDHISGGKYRWINPIKPQQITKEFIQLGIKKESKPDKFLLPEIIPDGERNVSLFKFGSSLRGQGLEKEEILTTLLSVNQYRVDPPLDENEIKLMVENIVTKYEKNYESDIYENQVENQTRFNLKTAKDVFKPREPREFIIDQFVQEGTLNSWYGAFGSKKSLTALTASVCVAMGTNFIGQKTKQSPVLIVDEESGDWLLEERLQHVINGNDGNQDIPIHYLSMSGFNFFNNKNDGTILENYIRQTGAKLVFIDTLVAIMSGGNENDAQTIQPIMTEFRRICNATGTAIVILHHENKNKSYRGSTAIAGAMDTMIKIESDIDTNHISFTSEKVRNGKPFSFDAKIIFEEDQISMEESDPFVEKDDCQTEILNWMKNHNGKLIAEDFYKNAKQDKEKYKMPLSRLKTKGSIEVDKESAKGNMVYVIISNNSR